MTGVVDRYDSRRNKIKANGSNRSGTNYDSLEEIEMDTQIMSNGRLDEISVPYDGYGLFWVFRNQIINFLHKPGLHVVHGFTFWKPRSARIELHLLPGFFFD